MVKRLALVEDDDVIRANYSDLLRQAGFDVVAYSGKAEALRAFDAALPDIALLDIALGDERDAGFELCVELRRRSPMPRKISWCEARPRCRPLHKTWPR